MATLYNIKTQESSNCLYAPWSTGSRDTLTTVTLKGYGVYNMNDYYQFGYLPYIGLVSFGSYRFLTQSMHGAQESNDIFIIKR